MRKSSIPTYNDNEHGSKDRQANEHTGRSEQKILAYVEKGGREMVLPFREVYDKGSGFYFAVIHVTTKRNIKYRSKCYRTIEAP